MPTTLENDRAIVSTRVIPFQRDEVFRALAEPQRLARWWGPAGFRNTFETFDFRPGGEWQFVMHGPDGQDYANHSVFEEIAAPQRVVVRHDCAPLFTLTITLEEAEGGTRLAWEQLFDDARVRDQVAPICLPANEQNFDRLEAELAAHP
jgi:uncharacterized protein YndB with AHSA1/START domain